MKNLVLSLVFATCVGSLNANAKASRLAPDLEKQVISLIDGLGADSWEERGTQAKVDAVLYDGEKQTVFIIYETRELNSSGPFVKQDPLDIPDIESANDVIVKSPSGSPSLNSAISEKLLESI